MADADEALPDFDIVLGDCPELTAGWNTDFIVNGEQSKNLARSFILSLPDGVAWRRDWPVIFNWHGVGVSADFFLPMLDGWQNNDIMPFILVTPEDTGLPMATIPPQGVDWDNLVLDDGSIEAELFDRILECLDRRFGVDFSRIHLTGFSAGSIACDSLAVMRGERVASIFTYSGAYFSNPENPPALGAGIANFIKWPPLNVANKFVQVLVHGAGDPGCGNRDCGDPNGNCCDIWSTIGLSVNFQKMAENDAPYLSALGHDVLLCNHGQGHLMGGVTQPSLIRFFNDHPLGTEVSPYRAGLTGEFAEICTFLPGTER
jgi:predicted esterase